MSTQHLFLLPCFRNSKEIENVFYVPKRPIGLLYCLQICLNWCFESWVTFYTAADHSKRTRWNVTQKTIHDLKWPIFSSHRVQYVYSSSLPWLAVIKGLDTVFQNCLLLSATPGTPTIMLDLLLMRASSWYAILVKWIGYPDKGEVLTNTDKDRFLKNIGEK